MRTFQKLADLVPLVGEELATSDWMTITQQQVNLFAEATGDHQWIHVDVERAKKGRSAPRRWLLRVALPKLIESSIETLDATMGVNYGLNKVRFTAPVPVGSRLRARIKLLACDDIGKGGYQMTWGVTVEREGSDKPVCVAESLTRRYA
jgi:acyl dehydratase